MGNIYSTYVNEQYGFVNKEGPPIAKSTRQSFEANDRSSTRRSWTASEKSRYSTDISSEEPAILSSLCFNRAYFGDSLASHRLSEEIITSPSTTDRSSLDFGAKKSRNSFEKGKSRRKSRPGPTAPKSGPTNRLIITCHRSKKKKKRKKNHPGPTRPGPTCPPPDNESSDGGDHSSSSTGEARFVVHRKKRNMPNWKQQWENKQRIPGLLVDDKSGTSSPRGDFQFRDYGVGINDREFHKLPKEGQVNSTNRRHMYFQYDNEEEDDREQVSPELMPKVSFKSNFSGSSAPSLISDLSLGPPSMSGLKSTESTTQSDTCSLSDRAGLGLVESPSVILQTSHINDLDASWVSPFYKDYKADRS